MADRIHHGHKEKHIVVLGAGLVGIATAYALAQDGHKVSVIDKNSQAALSTSFANGGHIATGDALPWTSFNFLQRLITGFWREDSAARLHLKADKEQWLWLLRMLGNLSATNWKYRAHCLVELAQFSQNCFNQQQLELNKQYLPEQNPTITNYGVLHLFSQRKAMKKAQAHAAFMQSFGVPCELLSGKEIMRKEPALTKAVQYQKVSAAVFFPNDKTGDAKIWTQTLADIAKEKGVNFHFNQKITALHTKGSQLSAVLTEKQEINGDIFVLALGTGSVHFARHFGLRLPVYPVRGYSITMETSGAHTPSVGLVDERRRIVISKLGNKLRLAGLADIGMNDREQEQRQQLLLRGWKNLIPESANLQTAQFWTGERPMTPDSLPIIGKSTLLDNLYLNTGHGALGWTLCHGAAQLIADLIAKRAPAIDSSPFSLDRFS